MPETAGRALARILSAAGVGAAYGQPLAGLSVREVSDPAVALLLAHAHRAVHAAPAVAHLGNGTIVVVGAPSPEADPGSSPRLPAARVTVEHAADLAALAPAVADALAGAGVVLQLDLHPDAAVAGAPPFAGPDAAPRWQDADAELLAEIAEARRVVVLAGPGVVTSGTVGGLHALAAAGRLGVLNTWGAKGVFDWQSPHHWATVGLQELDFELGGLAAADLVLATGIDDREAPPRLWARYPHRVVAPGSLGALAAGWPSRHGAAPALVKIPPLRTRLAAVTQAGWASTATPLVPSLVTRHYAQVMGDAGLVAADAGRAGFWVARTFATPRLGAASVPSGAVGGWAAACVLVARLNDPLRRAVAVVDGPPDDLTTAVLEEAARRGIAVGVEAWQEAGDALGPEAHRARLEQLTRSGGVATLATDSRQLAEMTAVAGPVRAWADEIRYR